LHTIWHEKLYWLASGRTLGSDEAFPGFGDLVARRPINALLDYLRGLGGAAAEDSDGNLLRRFLTRRDEAAFASLLRRHGPMVYGVCQRVLGDHADADDAFQATFLVLVRKAAGIRKHESVGSWLHGVASRIARQARISAARRRDHERQAPIMPSRDEIAAVVWRDIRPLLDEELERLPEKYRAPLVLCYLEGKSHEEAAQQLGWPNGTVCGRLARGRDLLRGRLIRRGLTLSAPLFATALAEEAIAALPVALLGSTTTAATLFAAGQTTAGGSLTTPALTLAEGALRAMYLTKLKTVTALLVAIAVLGTAGATVAHHNRASHRGEQTVAPLSNESEEAAVVLAQKSRDPAKLPNNQADKPGSASNSGGSGFGCNGGGFGFGMGSGFGSGSGFGAGSGSGSGGGFGSCKLAPLTQKPVQQELKLTRDQIKKLTELQRKQEQSTRTLISTLKFDELFKEPESLQKKWAEIAAQGEKGVDAILNTSQRTRLQEISLQQRGGNALGDPDVAEKLELTDEQKKRIQDIQAEGIKELRDLGLKEMQGLMELGPNPFDVGKALDKMRQGQKTMEKMRKKSEEVTKMMSDKCLAVLTSEQTTKWKEMTGKPFKIGK
jgi:RNA polymerase sigma factor (sigma-70 family)